MNTSESQYYQNEPETFPSHVERFDFPEGISQTDADLIERAWIADRRLEELRVGIDNARTVREQAERGLVEIQKQLADISARKTIHSSPNEQSSRLLYHIPEGEDNTLAEMARSYQVEIDNENRVDYDTYARYLAFKEQEYMEEYQRLDSVRTSAQADEKKLIHGVNGVNGADGLEGIQRLTLEGICSSAGKELLDSVVIHRVERKGVVGVDVSHIELKPGTSISRAIEVARVSKDHVRRFAEKTQELQLLREKTENLHTFERFQNETRKEVLSIYNTLIDSHETIANSLARLLEGTGESDQPSGGAVRCAYFIMTGQEVNSENPYDEGVRVLQSVQSYLYTPEIFEPNTVNMDRLKERLQYTQELISMLTSLNDEGAQIVRSAMTGKGSLTNDAVYRMLSSDDTFQELNKCSRSHTHTLTSYSEKMTGHVAGSLLGDTNELLIDLGITSKTYEQVKHGIEDKQNRLNDKLHYHEALVDLSVEESICKNEFLSRALGNEGWSDAYVRLDNERTNLKNAVSLAKEYQKRFPINLAQGATVSIQSLDGVPNIVDSMYLGTKQKREQEVEVLKKEYEVAQSTTQQLERLLGIGGKNSDDRTVEEHQLLGQYDTSNNLSASWFGLGASLQTKRAQKLGIDIADAKKDESVALSEYNDAQVLMKSDLARQALLHAEPFAHMNAVLRDVFVLSGRLNVSASVEGKDLIIGLKNVLDYAVYEQKYSASSLQFAIMEFLDGVTKLQTPADIQKILDDYTRIQAVKAEEYSGNNSQIDDRWIVGEYAPSDIYLDEWHEKEQLYNEWKAGRSDSHETPEAPVYEGAESHVLGDVEADDAGATEGVPEIPDSAPAVPELEPQPVTLESVDESVVPESRALPVEISPAVPPVETALEGEPDPIFLAPAPEAAEEFHPVLQQFMNISTRRAPTVARGSDRTLPDELELPVGGVETVDTTPEPPPNLPIAPLAPAPTTEAEELLAQWRAQSAARRNEAVTSPAEPQPEPVVSRETVRTPDDIMGEIEVAMDDLEIPEELMQVLIGYMNKTVPLYSAMMLKARKYPSLIPLIRELKDMADMSKK